MKKLYIFALVAMLFAACTTDAIDEQSVKVEEQAPDTLVGTFEGEDSRIQLENGKTVWTQGDEVSVFYLSNANQKWQYQGETGERTGNLKRANVGNATETMKRVVVVYPYNENYYINTDTYNVKASLPATQTYLKDSYGLDGNIMVSQSEYNQFSLRNVCGWLKIQLTGNGGKVQSIKLKGNNGEQVAGEIYVNSADATSTLASEMGSADDGENSAGGNLVFDDTILTEVVLNCGEGVTLSSEATAFYIALPPQTFESGVTVEIRDINGYLMTKSTDKEIIINRNAIQPMARFEFSTPEKIEYMATAVDLIWNYVDDANSDAGFEYTSRKLPLRISTTNSNISGYDYEQVVSNGLLQKVEVSCNGQLLSDIVSLFGGTNAAPTLHLSRFKWGKTYNISAIYILNGCEIEINATVKTIDRNRRVISIELADESVNIANSLTFTTNSESLPQRISNYAHELSIGNMTIEEYLKENLSTKWGYGMFSYASLVNGMFCPNSRLTIYSSDLYINASYSYTDFEATPSVLNYVCNVTTWYGQVIEFVKTVKFEPPTTFDFIRDPFRVNDQIVSNVTPEYTYPSVAYPNALYAFSLRDIQLWDAFHITKNGVAFYPQGDTNLKQRENLSKYLASNNLKLEYKVVTPGYDYAIDNANGVWTLAYTSKPASLNVVGALYLKTGVKDANGIDEYVKLPTKFDNEYKNYTVNGFNPIEGPFIVDTTLGGDTDLTKITLVDAKVYQVNIWEMLQIKDRRGVELFANGDWVVGNNTNGFYTASNPSEIYGAEMTFVLDGNIPAGIAPKIKCCEHIGIIEFDNYYNMIDFGVINLDVHVTLTHKHGKNVTTTIPLMFIGRFETKCKNKKNG
uniref:hypothetical protein n=1 Tax=Alistipes sp. TaxID=1872444 RepID=UPI0040563B89